MRTQLVTAFAWLSLALPAGALAKKPPPEPPPPVEEPAPAEPVREGVRTVQAAADLTGAEGARATVMGTLVRATPEGVEGATEGTAVRLGDGTLVFVSKAEPPEGWAWMLNTKIRVQGNLWAQGREGWRVPTLEEAESPMPGDVGVPGMGF